VLITTDPAPSRFAVITPKSVGNAVSRHAVARAVRHSWLPLLTQRPTGLELVVRAQTGAASLSVADWTAACQQAIESAVRRG
jgi:ribonuclease P protein component